MHHITITLRNMKITTANCSCGLTFGRGKTAATGAHNHIAGWNATYETVYAS